MIHSTAIIHPAAVIAEGVSIGAYSIIDADVTIQSDCEIGSHVVIKGVTSIGRQNRIFQFCSIGEGPQDKKYRGEKESRLIIGDGNTIREYVSIHKGTQGGDGKTVIGNNNWIMAYSHIAHDCLIGNNGTFANNATLAGHVEIDDFVGLGGFTGVRQFCHIGSHSFSAAASVIVKDVPPYVLVSGNTAKPNGLNKEGLKRHGYTSEHIDTLKKAYKIVYKNGLVTSEALKRLEAIAKDSGEVALFRDFISRSKRGIVR